MFSSAPTALDPDVHHIMTGNYVALAAPCLWALVPSISLSKPEEAFMLEAEATPERIANLRELLTKKSPLAAPLFDDDELARFFTRKIFAGAVVELERLNVGEWLLFLGDAAHSVFPATGEGVNAALEDVYVLLEAIEENQDHMFEVYNRRRIADVQALVKIALHLERNTHDKHGSVTELLTNITLSMGQKLRVAGPTKEDYMFGKELTKGIRSYSQIYDGWQHQISWIQPAASRIARLFGSSKSAPTFTATTH
eukprot:TRINITY_DN7657_c0_g1_i2.p1 TRINITY_DN7657_c0_g1~~TRINITY_DN7657_c0_g1_i2.p1  ORF type:complete len:254 (-),score=49.56 TRINITY_DN7657_c0_g1_i2:136-897(-)